MQAASQVDDPALRCETLAAFALLHFGVGRGVARERMDEALELERTLPHWPQAGDATLAFAFQLVWSGELDRARGILEESCAALNERDDLREADAQWLLSILEWRAGNWDAAARRAADTLTIRAQFGRAGLQPIAEMPAAINGRTGMSQRFLTMKDMRGISSERLAISEINKR